MCVTCFMTTHSHTFWAQDKLGLDFFFDPSELAELVDGDNGHGNERSASVLYSSGVGSILKIEVDPANTSQKLLVLENQKSPESLD